MAVVKRLTLTFGGTNEEAAEFALMEAIRRLHEGSVEFAEDTDGGGYYLSVCEGIPEQEWPRGVNSVRAYRANALVIRCPRFFADPAFVAWLNNKEKGVATWHSGGIPTDWSDAFVLVDPGLGGEGSEQYSVDFPQDIWDEIISTCRAAFGPSSRHHIVVWLQNVPPTRHLSRGSKASDLDASPTGEMVLDCASFFSDPAFVAWLNGDERKSTWHQGGDPDEFSDTFVVVPAALYGESCAPPDDSFPVHIWEAILSECRRYFRPNAHGEYIVVWLRNQ